MRSTEASVTSPRLAFPIVMSPSCTLSLARTPITPPVLYFSEKLYPTTCAKASASNPLPHVSHALCCNCSDPEDDAHF